ncbi:DUF927 domain-containing protein [Leisingera sp. MMG026]|uniref:DUF927 domain-containing protein n=1 Tax=Leisingera sp. MMG026 TaxID=2909982 RepID=UPI001F4236BF|nr:DUF927 domain-containing protein [Leisingera sp. MMG026]MCF6430917.1 DUF927 domain-containing protein [Leisingera sp. MMG026]
MDVATRLGWHGNSFALQQKNLRPDQSKTDLMIDMSVRQHFLAQSGKLEEWRELACYAESNSRACFAISAALAPPCCGFWIAKVADFTSLGKARAARLHF